MPAKNESNGKTNSKGKQYNPTITAFFDAPKFGMKDEDGNGIEGTAFLSANLDVKAFETIQKSVSIGTKLLLRQATRLNKNGGRTFYLEVLPPLAPEAGYKGENKGTRKQSNQNQAGNEDDV